MRVSFGVLKRTPCKVNVWLLPKRDISSVALWPIKYSIPSTPHAAEAMLDDVKQGCTLVRSGSVKEGSNLLERGSAIATSAFGENGELTLHVQYMLALAAFNGNRLGLAEKTLRMLLQKVDDTSTLDRFELRVMLIDCLRRQGKLDDAIKACSFEVDDFVERKLQLLSCKAWLIILSKAGEPHVVLNEAADLVGTLEQGSVNQVRFGSLVYAMQGAVSLDVGNWKEALERATKGQKIIDKWRTKSGNSKELAQEMGDVLTVQGKALLAGKNFLRAEETLDDALAQYGADNARAAEAMLALGQLFRESQSNMYAEGTYRKLMSVIARKPGEISEEHVRECYDKYAWFLRHQKRTGEAEEVENEYIRVHLKKT